MQQILKQAIEQMVRLGNELNWNPPIDQEYVNAINELRALRDATQQSVKPTPLQGWQKVTALSDDDLEAISKL